MKKRFITTLTFAFVGIMMFAQPKAKYVFYFIGDGMGVNQVNAAETYLGALQGKIGIVPLCFPSFPNSALVNTQSGTNGVTDCRRRNSPCIRQQNPQRHSRNA